MMSQLANCAQVKVKLASGKILENCQIQLIGRLNVCLTFISTT